MLKLTKRILFVCLAVLAALYILLYLFTMLTGRALITRKLEDLSREKVSMRRFSVTLPLTLGIRGLDIENLAKVDSLSISINPLGFLGGKLVLSSIKIVKPQITYVRNLAKETPQQQPQTAQAAAEQAQTPEQAQVPAAPAKPRAKYSPLLNFRRLLISEGEVDFTDNTVGKEGIKITVRGINIDVHNIYVFPYSTITNFSVIALIPWGQGSTEQGKIDARGWIDFTKRDMQVALKIADIDGVYLYPYYSAWVDLEKARIEKAKLNFSSNIHGLSNNVTAECHLELTDIVRKPLSPEESEEKAAKIADAVMDIFKALNQGKIVLDFTIRTKMDRPEFGMGSVKSAVEDKLAQGKESKINPTGVLILPAKLVEGSIRSVTDISKAVIEGTFAVGNELKKAVQDSFKKVKK